MTNPITKIEIFKDTHLVSPREWDNLGTMVTFREKGRSLGDKTLSISQMKKLNNRCDQERWVYRKIYTLTKFGCKAVESTVFTGINYVTDERLIEEYGVKNEETITKAIAVLESEIETYGQFLAGDVYAFCTFDANNKAVDSCGDFYGSDPFTNEMSEHIDVEYHHLLKIAAKNISHD